MTTRSLARRQSRRRGGVLICSRDVSGHTVRMQVTISSGDLSVTFLIMPGMRHQVLLAGRQPAGPGKTRLVQMPLTVSARLS